MIQATKLLLPPEFLAQKDILREKVTAMGEMYSDHAAHLMVTLHMRLIYWIRNKIECPDWGRG